MDSDEIINNNESILYNNFKLDNERQKGVVVRRN